VLLPVAARMLPETLPPPRRQAARARIMLRTYRRLFTDRVFVGLILTAGLVMSGMFAYIAGSSFVFQEQFGLDEQSFGLLFGVGAIWIIGATASSPRSAARPRRTRHRDMETYRTWSGSVSSDRSPCGDWPTGADRSGAVARG
jgi:predicted MFS family arabinose efflux permease